MKIAYFDCPTGISGDMCLGALVDAGVPLSYLAENLEPLGLTGEYHLSCQPVQRQGQRATKVKVELLAQPTVRHLRDIEGLIHQAHLPPQVEAWSLSIFRTLAIAEGAVHGIEPEAVHFHEVGATDALVDIVGTCLGLNYLQIEAIYSSALPVGGGMVAAAHGELAVPVPAVLQLFTRFQVPIYDNGLHKELVTPTGAAILTTLSQGFGSVPSLKLEKIGMGAGSWELSQPNILRLWLGEGADSSWGRREIIKVLETQLDDITPQAIAYVMGQLYQQGALEVFSQPITLKKSRLGTLLTVLCLPAQEAICQQILFQETTTLGIRLRTQERLVLERGWQKVVTAYGEVRLKIGYQRSGDKLTILNCQPEFEDCAQVAQNSGQPWQVVYQAAIAAGLRAEFPSNWE